MGKNAAQYLEQLRALLPLGRLWDSLGGTGGVFHRLLAALAAEPARVDGRAADLLGEADPRTAVELLADWEAWAGLPDVCTPGKQTLAGRRRALVDRLTGRGGQSRVYFIALIERLGYVATIDEYRPFIAGLSRCGDHLNGGAECRFYWRVNIAEAWVDWFRAGDSQCGDNLGKIGRAEEVECLLRRLRPAHTEIVFNYSGQ